MRGRRSVNEERVKEAAEESKASVAEEKTVRSETIYEGRLLKIRLEDVALPDGRLSLIHI